MFTRRIVAGHPSRARWDAILREHGSYCPALNHDTDRASSLSRQEADELRGMGASDKRCSGLISVSDFGLARGLRAR
jgi:hypothetical protein